ncbi:MAG: DNA polymerase IV [Proteobacteria bacterium]|nr:DNA polymerase IV [Pseudomonadota bacterium]
MTPRVIAHADMDAFYASVEQRDRPELRGRPVVVGGTGTRGVVSAASYEAREFGVHSAMPTALARQRCPHAIFLRGDMARYTRESQRLFAIFRDFTPAVEGLSLDEAFLDLTGTQRLLGPPREVVARLRRRVRDETGLAVSVGVAPVKMVAKIASAAAKPDGWIEVPPTEVRRFLDPLPVRAIWGIGPVAGERLGRAGFATVGDLARARAERLRDLLGDWGLGVARLARGDDLREVEPYRGSISMSEENTFGDDVRDRGRLEAAVLVHAESVARRLRRAEQRARTVVLKWRPAERRAPGPRGYALHTRRVTLPEPTDDGQVLYREGLRLLTAAQLEEPVRLIGVGVTNLVGTGKGQLSLFEATPDAEERQRLNRALDEIRDRFGHAAIARGDAGAAERAGLSLQIKRGEEPELPRSS